MRFLAIGDLHGKTENLFRLLDSEKPDGVLGVGDWGDPGEVTPKIWAALLARVPVVTVFGNHDDLPGLANLRNRDGSPVLLSQGERREFCGLHVAGVSGIWAKSHRLPHYVTDEDVAAWASTIGPEPCVDVLLTHGCALGRADRTPSGRPGGQKCFLDLVKSVQPHVHLCGHLHVPQMYVAANQQISVNTGALPDGCYALVTKENGNVAVTEQRINP